MNNNVNEPPTDVFDEPATVPPGSEPPLVPAAGEISAREAVRRAVADLGPEADVDGVLAYIQAQFGLTPPRGTAQTYLSLAKKDLRDEVSNESRRRGRPRKATNGHTATPPATAVEEVIEAVEILRDLCERLGDDNVRRLFDAL